MRFGCCGSITPKEAGKTGFEIIDTVANMGYDYIELQLVEIARLDETAYATLKAKLFSSPIRCEVVNVFFSGAMRLTGPEMDLGAITGYASTALVRAAGLGCQAAVLGSGGARKVPEGFPLDKAREQLAQVLGALGNLAQTVGITIVLEPLRQQETNIIHTVADGLALVKQVDHPAVKLLADHYHMLWENEDPTVLLQAAPYLRHAHIARSRERKYPTGSPTPDEAAFFAYLKQAGYQHRLSVEANTNHFAEDASAALAYLKTI